MYSIVSNLHLYLDRSAFKGVNGVTSSDGFRVYSAYTTFVYSQLQVILPNSFLGDISNWDYFMSIDLTAPDLPLKTASDLLKNKEFADLVKESELPTPSRFVEQALCFHKNVCILLLKQKLCKSKLVRGFPSSMRLSSDTARRWTTLMNPGYFAITSFSTNGFPHLSSLCFSASMVLL